MHRMVSYIHGRFAPVVDARELVASDVWHALLVSSLYLAYFCIMQPMVAVKGGQGWDGADYFLLAQWNFSTPVYPLVQRIGLPLLAGQWPTTDLLLNFRLINAVLAWLHGVVTWLMLAALLRQQTPVWRLLAWCLICAIQVAPIPQAVWYPVQNDIVAALFSQLLLFALLRGFCHGWLLFALFFFGTLCRENFAQYFIFFLFRCELDWKNNLGLPGNLVALYRRNWQEMLRISLPAVAGYVLATVLVSRLVSKGVTIAVRFGYYLDYVSWHHLSDVALGLINVLSAVWLFGFAARMAGAYACYAAPLPVVATRIITGVFLAISLGGGTNMERYLYWILPFMVIQSMGLIEGLFRRGLPLLFLCCLLYAAWMQRTFMPVDTIALAGCTPWDILVGRSAFMGHFGQQCESNWQPLVLFFAVFVVPFVMLLALWKPRRS